jgi:signal transduction histidine kinase
MRQASSAPAADTAGGTGRSPFVEVLLRTPLGRAVDWVAGLPASVHVKLLAAFLLVTALFLAMAAVSLQTIARVAEQSQRLDEAHQRVEWAGQIAEALARQMHFTALALLLRDEATVARILRENNRFNDTLARLEGAATAEERELIQQIRARQDQAMVAVADIANAVRDGRLDEARAALLGREDRVYGEIEALVARLVAAEQGRMVSLRDSVASANRRSLTLTGVFAAVSLIAALACGFVISWSVIRPIRGVEAFLRDVTAGRLGATMSVANRDELGALVAQVNLMSRELKRLVDGQAQAAAELRRLNEQLAQASRAKSEFLANMSHELRTPMNAILGFTEMLRDGIYGPIPAELEEPLTDIQTNGRHLLRLINDVLDLSKIEAGRMELAVGEYSVADVVESVRASLRSLAAERGLEFVARVPPEAPPARGDAKRIAQCLMNLAGNALKFTRRGRVEISVAVEGEEFVFRVTDTGIGIPKEELEHVFAEFRQVDSTVTREFGGTGLGLSITKKFVEMHGGRIGAESVLGQGSTFWFAVPIQVESTR